MHFKVMSMSITNCSQKLSITSQCVSMTSPGIVCSRVSRESGKNLQVRFT